MSLGLRIGKGEGFADLEWAMMMAMGAVTKDTVVITTVHDSQIVDIPESLIEDHDLTVDYIVTQTEIINCKNRRPKPAGIVWSKLEPIKVCKIVQLHFLERQIHVPSVVKLHSSKHHDTVSVYFFMLF